MIYVVIKPQKVNVNNLNALSKLKWKLFYFFSVYCSYNNEWQKYTINFVLLFNADIEGQRWAKQSSGKSGIQKFPVFGNHFLV